MRLIIYKFLFHQSVFLQKYNNYFAICTIFAELECKNTIILFYSGHGNDQNLLLSDYKEDDGNLDGIYPTSKLTSYFNGDNIRKK